MTNLTDAQLTALAIEHYPNPDDPDGCWSCCEAWVCPTAEALAELRELRAERRCADEYWAENVRLRAALVAVRQLCNQSHYVIALSGNGTVPPLSKGRALAMVNTIYRAALASVKDGDVLPATVFQIAGLRRLEEIPPYNPNSVKDGDA